MLIGVTGSISSGKSEVVRFLVNQRGFSQLYLSKEPELKDSGFLDVVTNNFISLEGLLKYITANWNKNFVIDNIADVLIIEALR